MTSKNSLLQFIDIDKICRICLIEGANMKSVFTKLKQSEILEVNVCTLSEVLSKVTSKPVNENDKFPTQICINCVSLIYEAYKFKVQFDHSYNVLNQYLKNCIKKEVEPNVISSIKEEEQFNDNDNVSDNFHAEAEVKTETKRIGTRSASKAQINKRSNNSNSTIKQPKRRGRRLKQKFKDEDSLSDSDEESTSEDKPILHPCPVCTKEFPALELREHAHTHKALKKYLRIPMTHKIQPNTKFYTNPNKNKPIISVHNRKVKLHKCVSCNYEGVANELRVHVQTHRNQTEYKCDQCQRVFKKLNHLNTHRVKHLMEFPYKCEHCGKGFVIKTNYDCHILTHNTNQELPHECSHCFKRFSNPEHLNRHKVIHTEHVSYSVKYKVCKCHHCLKTFKDKATLKEHDCVPIEQALNLRYPCKTCNKVFKNSSGLYNHNRNIHKLKGAKVLCSVCGNYVSNIYNHMMRHTGEKPFECNQCGKKFIGKPQLKQHLLVHSGLKPFVCSVCAKAFNNLYNLQVHERIHKGDRCHICNICNKGFLEKSYLKKHMNVHSKT